MTKTKKLKLEDFEKEFSYLDSIHPNNLLMANQHLAAFLNTKTNGVPDIEPKQAGSNASESSDLVLKLEKNVCRFLTGKISKLNRTDSEKLFESCLESIFSDKSISNHGYKTYIQLVIKIAPNLVVSNLPRVSCLRIVKSDCI